MKQEDEGLERLSRVQAGSHLGCGAKTKDLGDGARDESFLTNNFPAVATGR